MSVEKKDWNVCVNTFPIGGASQSPYREWPLYTTYVHTYAHFSLFLQIWRCSTKPVQRWDFTKHLGALQILYREGVMQNCYREGTLEAPSERGHCSHIHKQISLFFPTCIGALHKDPIQRWHFTKYLGTLWKAPVENGLCTHIHMHISFFLPADIGMLHKAPKEMGLGKVPRDFIHTF